MDTTMKEDQQLVELSKKDVNAFGRLFERYYDQILNYTLQRTGNVEIAKDITAETFFKALKNIRNFSWKNVPFSAWLYRIATNEIAAYYRKGTHRVSSVDDLRSRGFDLASPYDLEEEIIAAENVLRKHNDFQVCRKAIKQLPQKYQDVITLRYFADKKINEIATILDKPEGTIKSLLHRGLKKLKKSLLAKSATFQAKIHCNKVEE